jgi:hypothetical protein
LGAVLHKVLELVGNTGQKPPGNPLSFTVGIEKPQHSFWLLERLDQSVQQDSIEASIAELDAILMVLEEGVHRNPQCGDIPGGYSMDAFVLYGREPPSDIFAAWDIKGRVRRDVDVLAE